MLITTERPIIRQRPEDKFLTRSFLPPNPKRKGEGGLRRKGYFKHSYKKVDGVWHLCDIHGCPVIKAAPDLAARLEAASSLSMNEPNGPSSLGPQMDELPSITVVTVVLNNAKGFEKTALNVFSQDYPNFEFLVIDGGSTDGTVDVIRKYEHSIDYWVSEKDSGIADAFNKGITLSFGTYINFLNAGDIFTTPKALSYVARYLTRGQRILSFFAKFGSRTIPKRPVENDSPLCRKAMISHQASFIKTDVFREWGLYDTGLRLRMDYEFWTRILRSEKFLFVPEILVDYDPHGISGKNIEQFYEEELIVNKKYLNLFERLFRRAVIIIRKLQLGPKRVWGSF
ncbi:MAG: glycosyltransferase [Desulfobacterota bacterium]|nr:glycosyltransferase [Thermodesulfobacteriota bacterium]MDW8001815.1 glycosyltransferase family 2 protein [Deltaproteobacteria bacterium]